MKLEGLLVYVLQSGIATDIRQSSMHEKVEMCF